MLTYLNQFMCALSALVCIIFNPCTFLALYIIIYYIIFQHLYIFII